MVWANVGIAMMMPARRRTFFALVTGDPERPVPKLRMQMSMHPRRLFAAIDIACRQSRQLFAVRLLTIPEHGTTEI
jgi:hypothetical protein